MNLDVLIRLSVSIAIALCIALLSSDVLAATFTEQGATILNLNVSGRSVSLADIDNDGDLDAFFQGPNLADRQVMRNNLIPSGSLTFTNDTAAMLPTPTGLVNSWSSGWGDYNGDGRVDVFVGQNNASGSTSGDLLRNTGSGFVNETVTNNLIPDTGFHQNVGWVDIDRDLDLDLIIGMETGKKHDIWRQDWATHTFTSVGAAVGFQAAVGTNSYGMAIGDSDGDGDLDVYISTCVFGGGGIRNNFYKNMLVETGSLAFTDIADTNGTQIMTNSYGSEFVDLDNDGDLDLYATGVDGTKTRVFRNDGGNMFTDVETIIGHEVLRNASGNPVRGTDFNGSKAVDYDNDGDLDLYFHDNLAGTGINHKLFRNDGNWEFVDVTVTEGLNTAAGGVVVGAGGYDSAWGDLDRDGDQDLIAPNNSTYGGVVVTPERVFVSNASTTGNNWLYVELDGPDHNTTGIGASIFATLNESTPEEVTLRREANTNIGTFNQSDLPVHFGLGDETQIDLLRIQWPDGSVQALFNVPANQYLSVSYLPGDFDRSGVVDAGDYVVWRKGLGPIFKESDIASWIAHFGQSLPGGGGGENVPEPASVLMFLAAFVASTGCRRARA